MTEEGENLRKPGSPGNRVSLEGPAASGVTRPEPHDFDFQRSVGAEFLLVQLGNGGSLGQILDMDIR